MILCGALNSVETLSDWKSLNHNTFENLYSPQMVERTNTIIVRKFAYDSRTPQVEVNVITFKDYIYIISIQSISHTGVRPHRHVYSTMTQQNIAYNCNIINMSTSTHALLLVVPRPSLPPRRPTLPKPNLTRPSLLRQFDRVYLHPTITMHVSGDNRMVYAVRKLGQRFVHWNPIKWWSKMQ